MATVLSFVLDRETSEVGVTRAPGIAAPWWFGADGAASSTTAARCPWGATEVGRVPGGLGPSFPSRHAVPLQPTGMVERRGTLVSTTGLAQLSAATTGGDSAARLGGTFAGPGCSRGCSAPNPRRTGTWPFWRCGPRPLGARRPLALSPGTRSRNPLAGLRSRGWDVSWHAAGRRTGGERGVRDYA